MSFLDTVHFKCSWNRIDPLFLWEKTRFFADKIFITRALYYGSDTIRIGQFALLQRKKFIYSFQMKSITTRSEKS